MPLNIILIHKKYKLALLYSTWNSDTLKTASIQLVETTKLMY